MIGLTSCCDIVARQPRCSIDLKWTLLFCSLITKTDTFINQNKLYLKLIVPTLSVSRFSLLVYMFLFLFIDNFLTKYRLWYWSIYIMYKILFNIFFLNLGLFLSIFLWSEINDRKWVFFVILLRLFGYSWSTFYSSYFPRIKLSNKRKLITFFRFENLSQTQSIIVI